jgi:hypothetical protein
MNDRCVHHDNVWIKYTRHDGKVDGNEYFQISFWNPDEWVRQSISIGRYCVPGRCDRYDFAYYPGRSGVGSRIGYFTDYGLTMAQALLAVKSDLNKPQVAKMLVEACAKSPWHARILLEQMISQLAPGCRAARAMNRELNYLREMRTINVKRKE